MLNRIEIDKERSLFMLHTGNKFVLIGLISSKFQSKAIATLAATASFIIAIRQL